jgi:Protein of unknown function (DUF2868)
MFQNVLLVRGKPPAFALAHAGRPRPRSARRVFAVQAHPLGQKMAPNEMSEDPSSQTIRSVGQSLRFGTGTASSWRIEDVLDFEYLLEGDRSEDPAGLERRDRRIYGELIRSEAESARGRINSDRRRLFRHWLENRRRDQPNGQPLPGHIFRAARSVLGKGLILAGFASGGGAAAQLLRYDGVQPVNVAAYLGWLVLFQLLLVTVAALAMALRRTRVLSSELTLLTGFMRWLWTTVALRLAASVWERMPRKGSYTRPSNVPLTPSEGERVAEGRVRGQSQAPLISNQPPLRFRDRISAEHRIRLESFLGSVAGRGGLYRSVLVWPLIGALQLFGVCFNLGVIGVTLALVLFSDRAFGWQSAVNVSPDQIHGLLRLLALPWSGWFGEGTGWPSLEQIQGSHIILKDGIRRLATTNLVSWWPFLCLAVVTYGLLPRAALLLVSRLLGRRALRQLKFTDAACDRLHDRMVSEELETRGEGEEPDRKDLPAESVDSARSGLRVPTEMVPADNALLVLEPELWESVKESDLRQALRGRFHLEVFRCQPVGLNPIELRPALGEWTHWRWRDGQPKIIILQEAWEPPIAEKVNGLRLIRKNLGPSAKLLLVLLGRPLSGHCLTPVKESDRRNWERQTAALGDPFLRLESLVAHA